MDDSLPKCNNVSNAEDMDLIKEKELSGTSVILEGTIPADIGRLRKDRKPRSEIARSTSSSVLSADSQDRTNSFLSDRSSTFTNDNSEPTHVIVYDTGDPVEDTRLKNLHYAANEFYTVQKSFVKFLMDLGEVYPMYIEEYGFRLKKDLLAPIVIQLQKEYRKLIPFHKFLLQQVEEKTANWNSIHPNMAEVFLDHAEFLKMCELFLLDKDRFVKELTKLREDNSDFNKATICFEEELFNRGPRGTVLQLDQVHQTFMRYKLLMMRYTHYLHPESEEHQKANEATAKLEIVIQSVNEALGVPSNVELKNLYERFQYTFDVFLAGRQLIKQGEVLKQTRKELQTRYLVLFSDFLWVCRNSSSFLSTTGIFDMHCSYKIPVETVRTEISPHEDFEKILYIKSKERSCTLIFNNVKERDDWYQEINYVVEERRDFIERTSPITNGASLATGNQRQGTPTTSKLSMDVEPLEKASCSGENPPVRRFTQMPSSSTARYKRQRPILRVQTNVVLRAERDKPTWIPDNSSTKCLMDGCASVFTFVNRRHHCRNCGWLICSACSGRAPLSKFDFKKELVCPECYDNICEKCKQIQDSIANFSSQN